MEALDDICMAPMCRVVIGRAINLLNNIFNTQM